MCIIRLLPLQSTPKKVSIPWYRKLLAVFEFLPFLPLELILILTLTRKRRKSKKRIETGVSRTALGVSAMRWSLHQFGVLYDPYSGLVLPFSFRVVAHSIYLQLVAFGAPVSYLFRSTIGTLYSRTIFFDSVVENSNLRQFVILGAGFDFRAHRLKLLPNCNIFEVDSEFTQQAKQKALIGITLPRKVTYVSCNFSQENFLEKLKSNGFDPSIPTVFIMEGVLNYLSWEASTDVGGGLSNLVKDIGEPFEFMLNREIDTPISKFLPLGFSSCEIWLKPEDINVTFLKETVPGFSGNGYLFCDLICLKN